MKIGIDLDDVLGDFVTPCLDFLNNKYDKNLNKSDIKTYRIYPFYNISREQFSKNLDEFYQTDELNNLAPMHHARIVVPFIAVTNDLYLISARKEDRRTQTEEWLNKHYTGQFQDVILTSGEPKGDVCRDLGINLMIDDNRHHIESVYKNGTMAYIYNQPWNQHVKETEFNIKRVYNWLDIGRRLI